MNLLNALLILCTFFHVRTTTLNAQNVTIPDANFKAYLVGNAAINTNGDTEIQVSEATAYTGGFHCHYLGIADLTGIEAFPNLTFLLCDNNQITNLDLSQNTNLTELVCHHNQITSLDLSLNTALTILYCYNNQIISLDLSLNTDLEQLACHFNQLNLLDLSQNTNLINVHCYNNQLTNLEIHQNAGLRILSCFYNQLTTLDLSQNTNLVELDCSFNQLTSLNAKNGNNTSMTLFYVSSNPNLTCIEVDDSTYSANSWTLVDPTASFSTNCSGVTTKTNTIPSLVGLTSYPNPTSKDITIDFGKVYQKTSIQVKNITGQTVLNKNVQNNSMTSLELEGPSGLYLVKIQTEEGLSILKIIKE